MIAKLINGELAQPILVNDAHRVIIVDLQLAKAQHANLLQRVAPELLTENNTGLFIFVPDDVSVTEPVHIQFESTQSGSLQHFIYLGKNAKLSLVQSWQNDAQENLTTQCQHSIHLAERAELHWVNLQNENDVAQLQSHYTITQDAYSQLQHYGFHLGAAKANEIWQIALQGEYAAAHFHGLVIAQHQQHIQQYLTINHHAPHCSSQQYFKAIATDSAQAFYTGKVVVEKTGAGADAKQHSQNLLLSNSAQISTKPELEVYNDDVKASHGATVGQLDADALFFLRSRGIPLAQAEQMLLQAFITEQLDVLSAETRVWLAPIVANKLLAVRHYE